MIHYSCDRCRRTIDPKEEVRYVVKLEVQAALEPVEADESDDDRDYLAEIQNILERIDDDDAFADDQQFPRRTFDLCPECYRRFLQNPLAADVHAHLDFSSN
jgi:hypothetical protein